MNTPDQNKAAPNSNYQGSQQKADPKSADALKTDQKKDGSCGTKSEGSCGTSKDAGKDSSSCGTK